MFLHELLKAKISEWRGSNYAADYPAIGEILDYNFDSETQSLRYLRKAQFEALGSLKRTLSSWPGVCYYTKMPS